MGFGSFMPLFDLFREEEEEENGAEQRKETQVSFINDDEGARERKDTTMLQKDSFLYTYILFSSTRSSDAEEEEKDRFLSCELFMNCRPSVPRLQLSNTCLSSAAGAAAAAAAAAVSIADWIR